MLILSRKAVAAGALADQLEKGRVVNFSKGHFPMPPEEDLDFLRQEASAHIRGKNISYHPETDAVHGLMGGRSIAASVRRILKRHSHHVEQFLSQKAPFLTRNWRVATCSFRPIEERGRNLPAHASNELIHVDAGSYGATHGDRVLRFFVNINPSEDRVWATKGLFPDLLERYGNEAGITSARFGKSLEESVAARLLAKGLRGLSGLGLPLDRVLDGSPYDRAMRQFHNFMKDSAQFQKDPDGLERMSFEPYSAWTVFTDLLSHACLSGRFALVSTFIIPKENCRLAEFVPFNALNKALRR